MSELRDHRNYFVFDGVPSTDFELFVNGAQTFGSPGAAFDTVTVPGKSGDLIRFGNRYENIQVQYDSWIMDNMRENLRNLRSFLLSKTKYCRLEDTYNPDEYRMAYYSDALSPTISHENKLAQFPIVFNCKPQRYLKSGDVKVEGTGTIYLDNPSYQPAKPLIRIYGQGTLTVGSSTITVHNNIDNYVDIDCDLMDAYTGVVNRNSDIETNVSGYITIPSGRVGVSKTSGISKFEITPRWYYL